MKGGKRKGVVCDTIDKIVTMEQVVMNKRNVGITLTERSFCERHRRCRVGIISKQSGMRVMGN